MIGVGGTNPITSANVDDVKYLVGFVSALAGLFSEQAFVKLHDMSKTVFGIPDTRAADPR